MLHRGFKTENGKARKKATEGCEVKDGRDEASGGVKMERSCQVGNVLGGSNQQHLKMDWM